MRLTGFVITCLCVLYVIIIKYAGDNGYYNFAVGLRPFHALVLVAFGFMGLSMLFGKNDSDKK